MDARTSPDPARQGGACYTFRMRDDLLVTLYTRSGCHLCEETAAELTRLADQLQFEVEVVDIATDTAAHDQWWADIPVVVVGDTVLRAPINPARLQSTILVALRAPA